MIVVSQAIRFKQHLQRFARDITVLYITGHAL
jgi:hypothetical protein